MEYYTEQRPWGWFKILLETESYKVKELLVKPHSRLSYQSHTKRSEHWLMVKGNASITINDVVRELKEGESIDIPVGTKHRMQNASDSDIMFIEIQRGDYFGEDDITRYDDDYKRV